MDDAMVTARMAAEKKRRGASVLTRDGLSASQAINLMYDRLIDEGEADFLFSSDARRATMRNGLRLRGSRRPDVEAILAFRRYDQGRGEAGAAPRKGPDVRWAD